MQARILHLGPAEGPKRLPRVAMVAICVITGACSDMQSHDASGASRAQESAMMHNEKIEAEAAGMQDAPQEKIEAALDDAAQRLSVPRERIEVVSAERVTWRDGSIGCPAPGMMYTQALVPGYRIVLRADGRTLNYHATDRGWPAFCPAERVVTSAVVDGAR